MSLVMESRVQAVRMLTPSQKPPKLLGFAIDSPQAEMAVSGSHVVLQGWVLGLEAAAVAVRILTKEGVLREVAVKQPRPDVAQAFPSVPEADFCGFWEQIEFSILPSLELELEVVLKTGECVPLGMILLQDGAQALGAAAHKPFGEDQSSVRLAIAYQYIQGDGLEVGALHSPLPLPGVARVKYVDRGSVEELRRQYPELNDKPLVNVDIVDNGEVLSTVADGSQDFVIANHFLEHCQNPIQTVQNLLRVMKPGGILYMAVPDKRYSFDAPRPITTVDHLVEEYLQGTERTERSHYEEWVRFVHHVDEPVEAGRQVKDLMEMKYSIHFHVWTPAALLELVMTMKSQLHFNFEIDLFVQNGNEMIFILRKT
jgi:SAM-dependent methyltransferase